VWASDEEELVDDEEECKHSKGKVTPLVGSLDESTDETGNNHDLIGEDSDQDGWSWDTSSEEEIEKEEWCGDEPINVSDVEDLTSTGSKDLSAVWSDEFGLDRNLTKVGTHREVSDGSDHGDTGSDVVEETIVSWLSVSHSHESQSADSHDGADGKVPVRTMSGDLELRVATDAIVCGDSLISRHSVYLLF